jgi:hypothetical protein
VNTQITHTHTFVCEVMWNSVVPLCSFRGCRTLGVEIVLGGVEGNLDAFYTSEVKVKQSLVAVCRPTEHVSLLSLGLGFL